MKLFHLFFLAAAAIGTSHLQAQDAGAASNSAPSHAPDPQATLAYIHSTWSTLTRSMSNFNSGLQWDEPFGWAPTNWIAVDGLEEMGFREDARRIARKFDATIDEGYAQDGTIREKFNVVSGNSNVQVSTGYKGNEIGFGWSNAVYLKLQEIIATPAAAPAN